MGLTVFGRFSHALLASANAYAMPAKLSFWNLLVLAEDVGIIVTDISAQNWVGAFQEALIAAAVAGLTVSPTLATDVQQCVTDFEAGNFTAVITDLQKIAADLGLVVTSPTLAPAPTAAPSPVLSEPVSTAPPVFS